MNVKLFGKNVFAVYSHIIMRIDSASVTAGDGSGYELVPIKNFGGEAFGVVEHAGTTVSIANLRRLAEKNGDKCEGFVLRELAGGEYVGTVFVMYRGGNDIEYRIRHIPAYIFDVVIREDRRGRGLAGVMLKKLTDRLKGRGITEAYLAVSKRNSSAIRAYEKTGFTREGEKTFARLVKFNIPYHKL